jgi:hypothetical protein
MQRDSPGYFYATDIFFLCKMLNGFGSRRTEGDAYLHMCKITMIIIVIIIIVNNNNNNNEKVIPKTKHFVQNIFKIKF